jgi:hypothetical protein
MVVVAAFDLSGDSVPDTTSVDAALSVSAGPDGPTWRAGMASARTHDRLTLVAPRVAGILSLEALAAGARRASRERHWLSLAPSPRGIRISDLLLLNRPADSTARTLPAVAPLARTSTRLAPDETVGLYWEVYGMEAVTPLSISVTVVKESAGLLKRAARAFGLSCSERPRVSLAWEELGRPEDGYAPGGISLDLTGNGPGRYRIQVSVAPDDDLPVVAERAITIEDPRP